MSDIKKYTLYWKRNSSLIQIADVEIINFDGHFATYNLTANSIPAGVTHVAVKTKRDENNVHTTIVEGRILDLVGSTLRVPYGRNLTYLTAWLGSETSSVICRSTHDITRSALAYTARDVEVDSTGEVIDHVSQRKKVKASFSYFATPKKLSCLSSSGFKPKLHFNKNMTIDCQLLNSEPLRSSTCMTT